MDIECKIVFCNTVYILMMTIDKLNTGIQYQDIKPLVLKGSIITFDEVTNETSILERGNNGDILHVNNAFDNGLEWIQTPISEQLTWKQPIINNMTTPPISPVTEDRYIVKVSGTGDWVGKDNYVTEWNGSSWIFNNPDDGWVVWNQTTSQIFMFDGTNWLDNAVSLTKLLNSLDDGNLLYVDVNAVDSDETGTIIDPFLNVQDAVDFAGNGFIITIRAGTYTETILLPLNKSLEFIGDHIDNVILQSGDLLVDLITNAVGVNSSIYKFENITFYFSKWAIDITSADSLIVKNCSFINNGWDGTGLNTFNVESGATLGYDSSKIDLQAFAASLNVSDGGGIKASNCYYYETTRCTFILSNASIEITDCGIGSAGDISTNLFYSNLKGLRVLSSTGTSAAGCDRISVYNNAIEGCADIAIYQTGGTDCTFALNIIEKNWSSGVYLDYVSGTICDTNRLDSNGISAFTGNGEDAKSNATVCITGSNMKAGENFIAKIISNAINRSNSYPIPVQSIGIELGDSLSQITGSPNIEILENNVDNHQVGLKITVGAIMLANVKIVNLVHNRNMYSANVTQNIDNVDNAPYIEYPFSNTYVTFASVDVNFDFSSQSIVILPNGNTYKVNQLKAVGIGDGTIRIIEIQGGGDYRIQHDYLPFGVITINGAFAGASEVDVVNNLNGVLSISGTGLPIITSPTTLNVLTGDPVNYQITASHFPSVFSADGLPSGLFLNTSSGLINGTAPVWVYTDYNVIGAIGTTVVSPASFDISGINLKVGIDSFDDGNYNIQLLLNTDFTITNVTTIELLPGGAYPTALAADKITFRIAPSITSVEIYAANGYGSTDQPLVITVLPDASSDFVVVPQPFINTKSVHISQFAGRLEVPVNAAFPFNRAGNGSGSADAWSVSFWYKKDFVSFTFATQNMFEASYTPYIALNFDNNNPSPGVYEWRIIFDYGTDANLISGVSDFMAVDTNWHNVVVTYDGGTTGVNLANVADYYSRFNIYVDDVVFNSTSGNISFGNNGNGYAGAFDFTLGEFFFGTYGSNSPYGTLDEISMWDKELTTGQITDLYNLGSPIDLNTFSGGVPFYWWRMGDDDTYPTLTDNGTEGVNMTMTNMTSGDIVNDVP